MELLKKLKFKAKLQKAKFMRISGKNKLSGSKACLRKPEKYIGNSSLRDNSLRRKSPRGKNSE